MGFQKLIKEAVEEHLNYYEADQEERHETFLHMERMFEVMNQTAGSKVKTTWREAKKKTRPKKDPGHLDQT